MTFTVCNQKDFERAWAKVRHGDSILLVVEHKSDYEFEFTKEAAPDKREWSGCCC